jgi:flagellar L-ring protein precursor FlgH
MKLTHEIALIAAASLLIASGARADSCWPEGGVSLFSDNKAYEIGDVVTVIVQEESVVSNAVDRSVSKTSESKAEIPTLNIPSTQIFPGSERPKAEFSASRSFDGKGSYQLADSMETRLTAVVVEVLPNGNLVLEGSRLRQSVKEKVTIRLSGIVRPEDVRSDNTVPSSAVAQAKIVIESDGPNHRSTQRGILDRLVDFIWPF